MYQYFLGTYQPTLSQHTIYAYPPQKLSSNLRGNANQIEQNLITLQT